MVQRSSPPLLYGTPPPPPRPGCVLALTSIVQFQKITLPPYGSFLFCTHPTLGNSSLASYLASKILTPIPLGISNHLPWGFFGFFFWNCTFHKMPSTLFSYLIIRQSLRELIYLFYYYYYYYYFIIIIIKLLLLLLLLFYF